MNNLTRWVIRQTFGKVRGGHVLTLLDAIEKRDIQVVILSLAALGVKV